MENVKIVLILLNLMKMAESASLKDAPLIKYLTLMVNVKLAHHIHTQPNSTLETVEKDPKDVKLVFVKKTKSC